jgi:hypothetical protein
MFINPRFKKQAVEKRNIRIKRKSTTFVSAINSCEVISVLSNSTGYRILKFQMQNAEDSPLFMSIQCRTPLSELRAMATKESSINKFMIEAKTTSI